MGSSMNCSKHHPVGDEGKEKIIKKLKRKKSIYSTIADTQNF